MLQLTGEEAWISEGNSLHFTHCKDHNKIPGQEKSPIGARSQVETPEMADQTLSSQGSLYQVSWQPVLPLGTTYKSGICSPPVSVQPKAKA